MLSNSLPDADLNLPEMKNQISHVHQEVITCMVLWRNKISPLASLHFNLNFKNIENIAIPSCEETRFIIYKFNEIQENIDEITCIFQKVLFSLVKNIKSIISLVKNLNFWMTSAFFISFLCNSTDSLQNFKRL